MNATFPNEALQIWKNQNISSKDERNIAKNPKFAMWRMEESICRVFGRTIKIYSQTIKRNGDTKTANNKEHDYSNIQ